MNKSLRRRLAKLDAIAANRPIHPRVLRLAHAHFRQTGKLPQDLRLARRVIAWVSPATDPTQFGEGFQENARHIRTCVENLATVQDPVMQALWEEAGCSDRFIRVAARSILEVLTERGCDPTTPIFFEDERVIELTCASTALSILGFPTCLYGPPYQETGPMVVERLRAIGEQVGDEVAWHDRFEVAVEAFDTQGELPDEPLLRDAESQEQRATPRSAPIATSYSTRSATS